VQSATVITDKFSGQSNGFGFVEMAEVSDVAVAFGLLSNSELNGRRIQIEPEPSLRNGKARKLDVAANTEREPRHFRKLSGGQQIERRSA
jgi:RNA recognition motif-containing protein